MLANRILSRFLRTDEELDRSNFEHQRYATQNASDQQGMFTRTFASVIAKLDDCH